MSPLQNLVHDDVIKIALLLALSFFIGLEREEERHAREKVYFFGGVRTYPLMAVIGYLLVTFSPENMALFAVGFFVIGLFLVVSYWGKLRRQDSGITSEMAGLITYLIGGAIAKEMYWLAIAVGIINVFILQMKTYLENLAKRIHADEITTLVKFLLLTAVILPVIPNQAFTPFHINPYKSWLIVAAVSSISYGSYLMEKFLKVKQSTVLAAVFGGLYSSTVTTVVLAKKAKNAGKPSVFAGSILLATAMMYLRVAILLFIFNQSIFMAIGRFFILLSFFSTIVALLWAKQRGSHLDVSDELQIGKRNPLEIRTALLFAVLFVLMLVLTNLMLKYFGDSGVYSLAGVMGLVDVDPFILGLTQAGGSLTAVSTAAIAVVIASASNNLAKGFYTIMFADRKTGIQAFLLLASISVLSLGVFFWI